MNLLSPMQKKVSVEFSKWLIISEMYKSDLKFEELYDVWISTKFDPEQPNTNYIVSDNINTNGSHLQGEIDISYSELLETLGEPIYTGNRFEGDKVQAEWVIKGFVDGISVIATIYDYKNYVDVDYIRDWHIGGHNSKSIKLIQSIFPDKSITF